MKRLFALISLFLAAALTAAPPADKAPTKEPSKATAPNKLAVKKIGANLYKLGKITFNSKKSEIYLPATLEQDEVLIEYILTTQNGKIHETLFITDIVPSNLNIVMKLLNFKPSKELLSILDSDYRPTGIYHTATKQQKKHARFHISASWSKEGKDFSFPVTKMLQNAKTSGPMPHFPWIYSGSYMHNGEYQPDLGGDLIAVLPDRSALASYSGEGRDDDELWIPKSANIPDRGTKVTLTFKKSQPVKK